MSGMMRVVDGKAGKCQNSPMEPQIHLDLMQLAKAVWQWKEDEAWERLEILSCAPILHQNSSPI